MKNCRPRFLQALWAACVVFLAGASPLRSAEPSTVSLFVGQAHVLAEKQIRRAVIGNGKVIQATVLDDRQVLVIPESAGQSTLHLWDAEGTERLYVVTVHASNAERQVAEVRGLLGDATGLNVRAVGDKVVVEGGNLSEELMARVNEIVKRYPQVVNLVSRLGYERMIAIDVKMVEMRREHVENIGVRWNPSTTGPSFGVIGDVQRSTALRPDGAASAVAGLDVRPRIPWASTTLGLATTLGSVINLMAQNGDAIVLAEPSLSCRSGGSARFIAGGELPIPHSTGLGSTSVVFKEYGIKFDINPVASESGVIAARIATEVSAINFDVMVKDVPGLTKRRAETEVNLREHETLVIAGLLSEESSKTLDRMPGLADIPVLGALFRSRNFRDRKTELVVFVTPRFVRGEPALAPPAWTAPSSLSPPPSNAAEVNAVGLAPRLERARERIRILD